MIYAIEKNIVAPVAQIGKERANSENMGTQSRGWHHGSLVSSLLQDLRIPSSIPGKGRHSLESLSFLSIHCGTSVCLLAQDLAFRVQRRNFLILFLPFLFWIQNKITPSPPTPSPPPQPQNFFPSHLWLLLFLSNRTNQGWQSTACCTGPTTAHSHKSLVLASTEQCTPPKNAPLSHNPIICNSWPLPMPYNCALFCISIMLLPLLPLLAAAMGEIQIAFST